MRLKASVVILGVLGASLAFAQGRPVDFDKQMGVVTKSAAANDFPHALTALVQILSTVRRQAGGSLTFERQKEAVTAAATLDQATVLPVLERMSESYHGRDWEGALFDLTTAMTAFGRFISYVPASHRMNGTAADAETQSTPAALRMAAVTAMEAGLSAEAATYATREVASINSQFSAAAMARPAALMKNRSYNLIGLASLKQNDLDAAKKALSDSIKDAPEGTFQSRGSAPRMNLARELVGRGEIRDVQEYIEGCLRAGWKPNDSDLTAWMADIANHRMPSFPPLLLLY